MFFKKQKKNANKMMLFFCKKISLNKNLIISPIYHGHKNLTSLKLNLLTRQ